MRLHRLARRFLALGVVCGAAAAAIPAVNAMPVDFMPPPASYPACLARDLRAAPYVYRLRGPLDGVALRNASRRTCTLLGYATLRIVDARGRTVQIDYEQRNPYGTVPNAFALLAPRERTFFSFESPRPAGPGAGTACATYHTIRLTTPGDVRFVTASVTLRVCDRTVYVSPFYPLPD